MPQTVNKTLKRRKWTGLIEKEKKTRRREARFRNANPEARFAPRFHGAKVVDAFNRLTMEVLFMVINHGKYTDFKKTVRQLLKGQRVKLTDTAIRELYKKMKQGSPPLKAVNVQSGGLVPEGPYLQRLTTKGDEPITGNDMSKAIEEIITILNDAQYLQEDGGGITMPINAVLNYFNGNKEPLEYYLRYYKGPQFYSFFPPTINLDSILVRMDNIIDFLNIYKNDKNIKLRFAVEHGLEPEAVLKETAFQKMIAKFDTLDQTYNRFNQYRRLQFY